MKTGILLPEKKMSWSLRPETKVAIHWVSSAPQRVEPWRNFLLPGMTRR